MLICLTPPPRHFWLTFLHAFNCDCGTRIKRRAFIEKPKASYHITWQAHASMWYPIKEVKQAALLVRDESFHIIFENRRQNASGYVRKNGCKWDSTNQRHTLAEIEALCWFRHINYVILIIWYLIIWYQFDQIELKWFHAKNKAY